MCGQSLTAASVREDELMRAGMRGDMTGTWMTIFIAGFLWSAYRPKDVFVWALEVAPAAAAFMVLYSTRKRFPLTQLAYVLVLAHSLILMVGGHYTYAEVPLFDWLREFFGQGRNNYDKVGHFTQGFVPAIVAREILVRKGVVLQKKWLAFIVASMCLAISAFYELFEWWISVATGEAAEAFLGTQGYQWDTQSDMLFALIGAITALVLLSRMHDRRIAELRSPADNGL